MMRAIWSRLTGGAAPQVVAVPRDVPGEVASAIQAASYITREFHNAENGGYIGRVVVMLPGRRGAVLTDENAEDLARKAWPFLNDIQVAKTARMLTDEARNALAASRQAGRDADRTDRPRNYAMDW
ncbi:hypothetical protein [Bradyrhizobium glycinis]|uniref:hypothetical protein n=1 Tax=Bradyrhizobium glycinis TaxID=2751812 RepID=UPI0018D5D85E|nr:hypothetical protein [Bradyrhizobium glycinis]MBH5367171.1 hypothetical protein [Bradyrhizobium glycinis]